jgi:uncharacterized protein
MPAIEEEPPPIRLRGHHLLCMLTYKGLGYTPAFTENMTRTIEAISAGGPITLVEGPDDLCAALDEGCGHEGHCSEARTFQRDKDAIAALSGLLPLLDPLQPFVLDTERLKAIRNAFAKGTIRAACADCEWTPICDRIAADDFAESLLRIN